MIFLSLKDQCLDLFYLKKVPKNGNVRKMSQQQAQQQQFWQSLNPLVERTEVKNQVHSTRWYVYINLCYHHFEPMLLVAHLINRVLLQLTSCARARACVCCLPAAGLAVWSALLAAGMCTGVRAFSKSIFSSRFQPLRTLISRRCSWSWAARGRNVGSGTNICLQRLEKNWTSYPCAAYYHQIDPKSS